jgi:methylthioribose-1-phosphate isomerase
MIHHIFWKNNKLVLLDQRQLPNKMEYITCANYEMIVDAIKTMIVRGAPAIGLAASYGIAQAIWEKVKYDRKNIDADELTKYFEHICNEFSNTRPTAVNLFWAIDRMKKCFYNSIRKHVNIVDILIREAKKIHKEDIIISKSIGVHGLKLFTGKEKRNILTHCNAGALASSGYGTAVSIIRNAYNAKKINQVYVDETRPQLQGMRLTSWELIHYNIPVTVICDNTAADLMVEKKIDAVIVGADRIAANGDTASKIGSYALAVLAKHHKIPFWVAAPCSTIDIKTKKGSDIKIEERNSSELTDIAGKRLAPKGVKVLNPAFDIVPVNFIDAIITEKGIIKENFRENLKRVVK